MKYFIDDIIVEGVLVFREEVLGHFGDYDEHCVDGFVSWGVAVRETVS